MSLKTVIILLLIAISNLGLSQSNSSYSKKKFDKAYQQNQSVKTLLDSADYYLKTDRNKAFTYLEQAYLISVKNKNIQEQISVYTKLGEYYEFYKQHDLAAFNYRKAVSLNKRNIDIDLILKTTEQYNKAGLFEDGIRFLKSNENNFKKADEVVFYKTLGESYLLKNDNDSAKILLEKALDLSDKYNLKDENIEIKLLLAKLYSKSGNTNKEIDLLKQANTQSQETNKKELQIQAKSDLADFYSRNNFVEEEINTRNSIITDLEFADSTYGSTLNTTKKAEEKIRIAQSYNKSQQYDKALDVVESIDVESNDETADLEIKKEAAKVESEAYLNIGDEKAALKSYEEYSSLLDQLYKQKELEYQNISNLNNQLRNQQWRIDFLEKDKEIYDAEMQMYASERELNQEKLKYQKWYIILLVTILLLLIATIIILYQKNKVQKRHNSYLALKSLRVQMNPHFIFNALNSINNFIVKNDEINANKYLSRFSKLMRRILNNSEQDFIPIEQEIEILELYIQIEYMRFSDKFNYVFEIDERINTEDFQIPPMLIQPYIENAVWHGLRYKEEDGKLLVKMEISDDNLKVIIEDNGIGRKKSEELKTKNQKSNKSKGIKNTKGRLEILSKIYNKEFKHNISDLTENGEGTKVEILIPKIDKE